MIANQSKKLILRGIYLNYLHLLVGSVSILVLTPMMIRYLGQSAYGLWAVFNSLITYFILFDFGMNTAVAKYTAEFCASNKIDSLNKLVSSTAAIIALIGILIILACIALSPFVPRYFKIADDLISTSRLAFIVTGINVSLLLFGGVFSNTIYGFQRVDVWKLCGIVQLATNIGFTVLFLRLGFGLVGATLATTISSVILVLLYLTFIFRSHLGIKIHPKLVEISIVKETAPYSIRTFVLGLTSRLLYYTDYIVIGIFLNTAQVAPYEIAYKLCFLTTYLFSVISTAMFPKFSGLYALGQIDHLKYLYLKIAKVSLLILTPLGIFFIFFGHEFIAIWVGEKNFAGMGVLLTLTAMNFLHAIGTPACMVLQSIGKNKEIMYSEIINAALNLILSVILVKKLGIMGVALATLVASLLTSFWVIILLTCKFTQLTIREYLQTAILPPLVVGIVTGGFIWYLKRTLLSSYNLFQVTLDGICILIIYSLIYLLAASTKEERRLCFQILSENTPPMFQKLCFRKVL